MVQEAVIKIIPKNKKCKKTKWLSKEDLQIAEKRREAKVKREKERYSHFFKNFTWFVVIHTVKGFGIVNKAKVDVFLELSCFFDDPADVGNLISGSSTFSKSSLNILKFRVHVLLKPGWRILSITLLA